MPTNPEILAVQPDAGWTNFGGANATISVANPDDADTSYIFGTGLAVSESTVTDTTLTSETINSVTVRARLRMVTTSDFPTIAMSDNAFANTVSSSPNTSTTYTDYVGCTSATAPSGGAWTVAKVNSLKVRVTSPDLVVCRATTITVEVAWTAAGGAKKLLLLGVG
jgi:hypothetical protein